MMKVSVNNAGSIFNVMSTHKGVLDMSSVGARTCGRVSSCIGTITRGLVPVVRRINNGSGVGNVNVNTPGKGFCANGVRFTPGLP